MSNFSEEVFLWALTTRPEDAKRFSTFFNPEWLQTVQYRPILEEIYRFTKEKGTPPNLKVLHDIFEKRDSTQYTARYKKYLEQIGSVDPIPELSEMIYTLDQAKDVAVSWSLKEMMNSHAFQSMNDTFDGVGQIKAIQSWLHQFFGQSEDIEYDIKQAVSALIAERGWMNQDQKIPCGVQVIDDMTTGGLRPKQVGIVMAPTGHGKSVCLMIMAQKMASIEGKRVLFISNELSMSEVTERFLCLLSGHHLNEVIDDPICSVSELDYHWKYGLDGQLRLIEVNREISIDDIESIVGRYANLYGWTPEVVVLDFMERMKPSLSGYKRDQSWNWYGAIANDLVRTAKKNNWLIWTAVQTNRAGLSAEVQEMSHAQGSIRHFQEAAAVVAMHQQADYSTGDDEVCILAFKPLKLRHSRRPGETILVKARLGNMEITNDRIDVQAMVASQTPAAPPSPPQPQTQKPVSARAKQVQRQKKKK